MAVSLATSKLVATSLPSCDCGSTYLGSAYYTCCGSMNLNGKTCTCDGSPCTQCSPSIHDKQKVLPLSPFKKPSVVSALPPCNGCSQSSNGVYYACCKDQSIVNDDCTCDGGPCTQCSPDAKDREKVSVKPVDLPSCDCGDISFKGAHYTCCGNMQLDVNGCTCDGAPCTQCSPNEPFKPMVLDSCSCNTMQMRKTYYSCCGTMSTANNVCTCDGSPCTPCSPSADHSGKALA
jgi:hypothetical protein